MTNRFLLPLLLATTTLAAFSGCTGCESVAPAQPDAGTEATICLIDDDCEGTDLCIDGVCQPDSNACVGNADCADGTVCRAGQCTDPEDSGECTGDDGCAATERCTTSAPENACLVSPECALSEPGTPCDDACWGECTSRPACDDDSDCAVTERCDDTALVCVAIGDCDVDSDCPVTASCIDGTCTDNGDCTADEDCDGTQSCVDGDCTRNGDCDVDSDCPDDQVCGDNHLCERRDPCTSNDDCAVDEICDTSNDGGTCVVIGDCTTVNDCPTDPEIACLDGVCTRAPCGRDSDCDDGAFCNGAETCNPRVGCVEGRAPSTGHLAACADEVCDEVNDRLVITPVHARCADNSPCTDDVCVADVGCTNPENDFAPAPGPVNDCVQTVCLAGAVTVVIADGETPPQGPTNDCAANVCDKGVVTVVAADAEVPPQTSTSDCRRDVCSNLVVVTVADNTEVLAQTSATDCVTNACVDGAPGTVANDNETPTQTSSTDCQRETCVNKAVVRIADNSEVLAQTSTSDCVTNACVAGVPSTVANDSETPTQTSSTDCQRETCVNKAVVRVADNNEVLTQTSTTDCVTNACVAGAPGTVANNSEIPTQTSSTDCQRETCSNKAVVRVADNTEVLTQTSSTDCRTNVCVNGAPGTVANNSEVPPDVGCKDGVCVNGAPTSVVANGNCVDAAVCTNGTCNVDGSCTQTPDDDLCNCAGTQVGLCLPGDPRAPATGGLAGCVCQQPATLSCGVDDNDDTKRVLERFELFATAPGAKVGTTFVWDIAGVPVGGDAAAQVLSNATSATAAAFQATTPSVTGKDYVVRVTMSEPELPAQTCQVALRAEPLPDTLQVSVFMNDSLDVDVHLTGGVGADPVDMVFHELHADFGLPNRNCFWQNCAVCTASVPGQSCIATGPLVDFSNPRNTASYSDPNDPQLDIDNVRGCFTGTNGDLSCVPEKITVENPPAGTYWAFGYLFGNAFALNPGGLTSPATTTVRLDIECRGVKTSVTRTLRSDVSNGSGTAASATSSRRYGGTNGEVEIVVPVAPGAPCIITP
jgi:hypothetical protein